MQKGCETMRLLIVGDERALCGTVGKLLRQSGYGVDLCHDGGKVLERLLSERYDLVLLDLSIPGLDGLALLRALRTEDKETKVIMLSAQSDIAYRVAALDAGANDVIAKPFHPDELEARVRSLTRRRFIQEDLALSCGALTVHTKRRMAVAHGRDIPLTRKEKGILEYLLLHQDRPVSQEELIEHVWDSGVDSFSNSIRVHISSLRKKLKAVLGYDPIRNRIGEGYQVVGRTEP